LFYLNLGVLADNPCVLEFLPGLENFISLGSPDCITRHTDIETIEVWINPNAYGTSFTEGVLFNSGWMTIGDRQKAYVLSVKNHEQLMGYCFTRADSNSQVTEEISASRESLLKLNQWSHIVWQPSGNKFWENGIEADKGTVYGKSLNGMGSYEPGDIMTVGDSYSGQLTALRLWAAPLSPEQIETAFRTGASSCTFGSMLLAFWDFSCSAQQQIPTFTGTSCGVLYPESSHYKYIATDGPADIATPFLSNCSLLSSCPSTCQPSTFQHNIIAHRPVITDDPKPDEIPVASKPVDPKPISNNDYPHVDMNLLVVVLFSVILMVIVVTTLCFFGDEENQNNGQTYMPVNST